MPRSAKSFWRPSKRRGGEPLFRHCEQWLLSANGVVEEAQWPTKDVLWVAASMP